MHNLSSYKIAQLQTIRDSHSHPQPTSFPHNYSNKYYAALTSIAKSLRLRYMRVTGSSCRPHEHQSKPSTTSYLYRHMKFLPKANIETPLERYTGVGKLETYIETQNKRSITTYQNYVATVHAI